MAFLWNWFTKALNYIGLANKDATILFLGLDNAGKTTLLHMLRDNKVRPSSRPVTKASKLLECSPPSSPRTARRTRKPLPTLVCQPRILLQQAWKNVVHVQNVIDTLAPLSRSSHSHKKEPTHTKSKPKQTTRRLKSMNPHGTHVRKN